MISSYEKILKTAQDLRWEIGGDFHEKIMESLYMDASQIADRATTHLGDKPRFDLDRMIDRLVTSRIWGFPLMLLLLTGVFWLTITGANYPSGLIFTLLIEIIHPFLKGAFVSMGIPWWIDGVLLDGAYDGDLFSSFHFTGGFWISTAGCVQFGSYIQKSWCSWETIT
jgi:ferrous iron transport protein B